MTYIKKLWFLCLLSNAFLCQGAEAEGPYIDLMEGVGKVDHPLTTQNEDAKKFFDQGLAWNYAYNYDAAYRSFKEAARLDPQLAMAYWGIAFALGFVDESPEQQKEIKQALDKAKELAANASPNEQAYIWALGEKYKNTTAEDEEPQKNFANAFKKVSEQFPEDLDAAAIYGEAGMDAADGGLWNKDGSAKPGTDVVVEAIESVLRRNPDHIGANHFYVHAIEGSKHPERALAAAHRSPKLFPASGHFQHMPSHIYIVVGDYQASAENSRRGMEVDIEYMKRYGEDNVYAIPDALHCGNFVARSFLLEGRFEDALTGAMTLKDFYQARYEKWKSLDFYLLNPVQVLVPFHRWEDILQFPFYDEKHQVANAYLRYARTLAYSALGQQELADQEKQKYDELLSQMPKDVKIGAAPATKFFRIASLILDAKKAKIQGDYKKTIELLKQAEATDNHGSLSWFFPFMDMIGAELILTEQFSEAEKVFRHTLNRDPRNPRALYGLYHCLKAQGKDTAAYWVMQEVQAAWQNATVPLSLKAMAL